MARSSKWAMEERTLTASTVAPVKGLNTLDRLMGMSPEYAVRVQNWIATPQGLQVRQGFRKEVTGMDGYVQTLMEYKGTSGNNNRLFAATPTKIYNATTPTASPPVAVSGLNSGLWSYCNFASGGGVHYLVACNGVDNARFYDGAAWGTFSLVTTPTLPGQIANANMSSLTDWKQVIVHQKRIWITHPNSTKVHYLDVNTLGGPCASIDFGSQFSSGGNVANIASASIDTGLGLESFLVITSTTGETLIYRGDDPATAATWAFAGSKALGEPISANSSYKFGGDTLLLSKQGVNKLSDAFASAGVNNAAEVTLTIQPTISEVVNLFSTLPGFQMIHYPGKNLLILNVPQINADANFQFVYNTLTKGWTQFVGLPAQCWAYFNGEMYFGANGYVGHAFVGYIDGANASGVGGDSYIASVQQAFDNFEKPGQIKGFIQAKVNLQTAVSAPRIYVNCNTDFATTKASAAMSISASGGSVWDAAKWDISTYGYGGQIYNSWQTISGTGTSAGLTLSVVVNDYTLWVSTDWVYELGGVLG